jgi:hypothetical protein
MICRFCESSLNNNFVDLGFAPPSNAYLKEKDLENYECYLPLKISACEKCWLVQTHDFTTAEYFFNSQYAYFSSTSIGWLKHAELYVENIIKKLCLNENSFVLEIASNDGYLLKNFLSHNIPCLGVEPTECTAIAAEKLGVSVIRDFFGSKLANLLYKRNKLADLIIGNNVYAHVPDIVDVSRGLKVALKSKGTITLEFPHLLRLIQGCQFDTLYHEHFSYLSLNAVSRILEKVGLKVYDVEELNTHGGSLRLFISHVESEFKVSNSVSTILKLEIIEF